MGAFAIRTFLHIILNLSLAAVIHFYGSRIPFNRALASQIVHPRIIRLQDCHTMKVRSTKVVTCNIHNLRVYQAAFAHHLYRMFTFTMVSSAPSI